MTKLRVFAHAAEAQLAKSLLATHGIRAEILAGSTVMVTSDRVEEARSLIDTLMVKDMMLGKPRERVNHFKKGILFALGAPILIPVVFNYWSLKHAWQYWENSRQETEDILKVGLIVALNIPTYFIVKAMFSMVGNVTSMMGLPTDGVDL